MWRAPRSLRYVDQLLRCKVNIFNISKINAEVRGGKSPRIKRLSEYIGDSYFDYLAGLGDLVLIMDESHRYRASAGVRAINELKPVLGLELTATPFVETGREGIEEARLEDHVVGGLVDFDDISYDDHADLLYNLAAQTVRHLCTYLSEDETRKVLRCYQRDIAKFIHAQMQEHYWEEAVGYEVKINKGFTELKRRAYTQAAGEAMLDFRQSPPDKSNMARYLFTGFSRCLYTEEKFHSEAERKLAVILDRESLKWFKPAKGQFQIFYRNGADHLEYQPDFVAETRDITYMLEPKARNEMTDPEVLAKRDAAVTWCDLASKHAVNNGGKPWKYVLIPHDAVAENMTLAGLASQFAVSA